jgi:DMSO/TMAO reductase YedYZ molybdopterin-dependent catalytic subunit
MNDDERPQSDAIESEPPVPEAAEDVNEHNAAVLAASARYTRRSFAVAGLAAAAGFGFYRWVDYSRNVGDQPLPRRRAFEANAAVARNVFAERGLAPTYPLHRAVDLRINGLVGLEQAIVPEQWRLQVAGVARAESFPQYAADIHAWEYEYVRQPPAEQGDHFTSIPTELSLTRGDTFRRLAGKPPDAFAEAGPSFSSLHTATPGLLLTLADVQKLPHHELVTEFKCVEGWSEIAHWAGVRMADFIEAYPPAPNADGSLPRYVYMETPAGDYYVGYDLDACRHPQTLLVTEMAGKPLTQLHGAPLRLHAPIKYGYKQIKRIGLIAYTDDKPDDYWTKLGYDWYAGL